MASSTASLQPPNPYTPMVYIPPELAALHHAMQVSSAAAENHDSHWLAQFLMI
ncbi:hypothetical protein FIBSPDRAFT_864701, partial [Athelia psychrophila]